MRLAVLALVALVAGPASAQRARPFAERGDVALVVGVSGVTDLVPAFGGVGARYRVRDRTVVGASVGVDYADRNVDVRDGFEADERNGGVRVSVWNENHVGRRGALVSPFVGVGVQARASGAEAERSLPCEPGEGCTVRTETASLSSTAVGVGALLGAEVRVARGVTLGAAYALGAEVSRDRQERTLDGEPRRDRFTTFRAGTGLTPLILSVYF